MAAFNHEGAHSAQHGSMRPYSPQTDGNRPAQEITAAEDPSAPNLFNFMAYPAIYAPSAPPPPAAPAAVDSSSYFLDPSASLPHTQQQAPHTQLMSLPSVHSPKPYDGAGEPNRISLFVDAGPMSPAAAYSGASAAATATNINSSEQHKHQQQQHHESTLEHWLVPDKAQVHYWALWTSLFTLCACFVFAFMAGQFGTYQQSPTYLQYHNGTASTSPLLTAWGPSALLGWLKFWVTTPINSFDVGYLMAWGARYQPSIAAGEWWRLFSSICIHGSFSHLFSNMFALVILAVPLEHTYGPLRIFVIFLAAGFGGTFMSMAFEDPCYVYVGASGAVFGFLGLYIADIVLNFESMFRPVLRLALMLMALGLTLGIEFATARASPLLRVSHMSHVGGLLAGLFVSFMFLPNLKDRRWKSARKLAGRIGHSIYDRISHGGSGSSHPQSTWGLPQRMQSCWRRNAWLYWLVWMLSALVMLFMFCGLPVYVWLFVMPALQCAPLTAASGV